MTAEELIDQAGHRLGRLMKQPGYRLELERLITLAKNEARREAAELCARKERPIVSADNDCFRACAAAILATLEEVK